MTKAVYPGSFDPFTNGHLDILKRASKIFDEVHILISENVSKNHLFSFDERIELIKKATISINNIKISYDNGLVVNYCKKNNINVIIRGIRNSKDLEDEISLSAFNKDLYPEIETIILLPKPENQIISSSAIKELLKYDCDITKYVPTEIAKDIKTKIK